uniref:Uncharacterized protein n=1 Tax=Rangifer tarandus platyrhynchus TaxID=3082113 RepID=A0ACB0ER17_RANTA|nr:unnamed protein product [Rangifer tarandus platyrhynchus]
MSPRPLGQAPPPDRPRVLGSSLPSRPRRQTRPLSGPPGPPPPPRLLRAGCSPAQLPAKPGLESGIGPGPAPCARDRPPSTCTPLSYAPTDPGTPKSIRSHSLSHSAEVTPRRPLSGTF